MKKILFILLFSLCFIFSYSQEMTCDGVKIKYKMNSFSKDTNSTTFLFTVESIGVFKYKYPELALKKGIQGLVIVGFDIDENCKIRNAKILRGLGSGLDEIALKTIKCVQRELDKVEKKKCLAISNVSYPVGFKIDGE